ncbi:hypothetical protein P7K49_032517, partial [Saguinus oedipus]
MALPANVHLTWAPAMPGLVKAPPPGTLAWWPPGMGASGSWNPQTPTAMEWGGPTGPGGSHRPRREQEGWGELLGPQ